jgi:hypothetical protein
MAQVKITDETPIDDLEILRILGDQLAKMYGAQGEAARRDLERIAAKVKRYDQLLAQGQIPRG